MVLTRDPAQAAEQPLTVDETRVLTNLTEIWTLPEAVKARPWPIRTEFVVYYYDPGWGTGWGECDGQPSYLPLGKSSIIFKYGQRIRLDGFIQPDQQQVIWEKTEYSVVQEGALPPAISTQRRLGNPKALQGWWVEMEGLVDTQTAVDTNHLRLNLLVEGHSVTVHSQDGNTGDRSNLEGYRVRLKGVFTLATIRGGGSHRMELWAPDLRQAAVIDRLSEDSRFETPVTTSAQFGTNAPEQLVRVEGVVKGADPGRSVTIWDSTGQIEIRTLQTKRFSIGQKIEAIGYPAKESILCFLERGLVRVKGSNGEHGPSQAQERPEKLFLAGQIRELAQEEAARNIPARLEGILLWYHPRTPFIFLQDASGGVRVHWSRRGNQRVLEPGTIVRVEGVTTKGEFCPVITNAVVRANGSVELPEARFITLEQAMTGVEEGMWVEMRGCVREINVEGNLRHIKLAGSSGEFEAVVPSADWMDTIGGSVARVRGVCTAVCNARGHLKSIRLYVPQSSALQLEEPELSDPFQLAMHPLAELRRFNALNSPHRRVRTSGTVLLHAPGQYLYVQDVNDALFVLSRETTPLNPGDRVDLVGFPGNRLGKFLLREASYRRLGPGRDPTPIPLYAVDEVEENLENRLIWTQGRLVEVIQRDHGIAMFVQSQGALFEAVLDEERVPVERLQLDSKLSLTGVYEIQRDEYGDPRAFRLRLRSGKDVRVLEPPPWWTPARLIWIVSAILLVCLLALLWGLTVSRKKHLLEQAQLQLESANHSLESRVEERTRELHEQVLAKEAARQELAAAQERLMLASRQAGMAEVATSVLHNVGNVLNSVNISSTVLNEMVRKSRTSNLAKVTALLREHETDLGQFLSSDPKGRQIIGYLENLAQHLDAEKQRITGELKGLHDNLEHISEIVSMQQSYARAGGVLELVKPSELAADALRMQAVSLKRHAIEIVRDFADLPVMTVDRHKVLQILNNLLQNAKDACDAKSTRGGQVAVRVSADTPEIVRFEVSDNGIGIAPENLTRIFSLGFTTRKGGHGFGLHSAALAAKQMGGSLHAESKGTGLGACFVLELPVNVNGHRVESVELLVDKVQDRTAVLAAN